jgi:hypothetical protein
LKAERKPSVNEEKFMEILKGSVVESAENQYAIRVLDDENVIDIPISVDSPSLVKLSFNKLILRLKKGKFKIVLEGLGDDLFSQVAGEYVKQLNKEILEIHGEMVQYRLVEV